MFDRILKRLCELVHNHRYVMTIHAEEETESDGLNILDVENVIISGRIIERQKDGVSREWKYLVKGETVVGDKATVVAKISPTGKAVIITVFRD